MSKPQLHDLPAKYQAQAIAQLHATPRPKTVRIEVAPEPVSEKRVRRVLDKTGPLLHFANYNLPIPLTEHRFHHKRKWRFDYCWPTYKVALEVEGGVWTNGRHTRGSGFVKDMEKYNAAALLGWRVVRCVPAKLRTAETAALIGAILKGAV